MDSLNSRKTTTLKDVVYLARIAGRELNDDLKRDVRKKHMLPAKQGNSYFTSSEELAVWRLIQETCNFPDVVTPHSHNKERYVLKKRFNAQVGIHGKTGLPCGLVIVIYDVEDQRIVTAFPSI